MITLFFIFLTAFFFSLFFLLLLGNDDDEDDEDIGDAGEEDMLRTQTVEDFLVLLVKPRLPEVLAQVCTCLRLLQLTWRQEIYYTINFLSFILLISSYQYYWFSLYHFITFSLSTFFDRLIYILSFSELSLSRFCSNSFTPLTFSFLLPLYNPISPVLLLFYLYSCLIFLFLQSSFLAPNLLLLPSLPLIHPYFLSIFCLFRPSCSFLLLSFFLPLLSLLLNSL